MKGIKKEIKKTEFEISFSLRDHLRERLNAVGRRDPKVLAKVALALGMPQYLVLKEAIALSNSIGIKIKEPFTWQAHEELLVKFIEKKYPDYKITPQQWSKSAQNQVDVFAIKKGKPMERLVADSKFVKILEPKHIVQIVNYARPKRFARIKILFIAKDTEIRDTTQKLADEKGVIIEPSHKKIVDGKRKIIIYPKH